MARLIDADALNSAIEEWFDGVCVYDVSPSEAVNDFQSIVDEQPTISPDEVGGVGEITGDDACPLCGCWIPTDDAHDAIFKNEVKFCYYCGMRLRMKGAEDGTTD